ncbi:hypothetical protein HZH66_001495 [Vespula vulgaris]|uniref:Tudor domain-containing protein 1 n=2 Tax=Vespula vulgaris TaxID=7454 RepID=A0A834KR81_VESVU|nr:uncharacterized protein LOC127069800 isoform X1 [Vespula vulgaris]KAF7412599.1 hypothetical protein HZH66_001495 [Vespula vulgaris]
MAYFQSNIEKTEDSTKPKEYRLYVANIPVELNEGGVLQIFKHYGTVTGLFYLPNTTWAFVIYGTYREAEYAIRSLHDKPPLRLQVSFGKDKSSVEVNQEKMYIQKSSETYKDIMQDCQYNEKAYTESVDRGTHNNALHKRNLLPKVSTSTYHASDGLLYPIPTDHCIYDPYENAEADYKNTLWARGKVTITRDGKRHVSYGRGYTSYEIPEPHPETEIMIKKIYDKRFNGLYEHGQDSLKQRLGTCVSCNKITPVRCGKCYAFYCSKECQVTDWPRHKIECQQIPTLIEDVKSLSTSSSEEQIGTTNLAQAHKTLRRPKQSIEVLLNKNAEIGNNKCTEIKSTESSEKRNVENNFQIKTTDKNDKIEHKEYKLETTKKEVINKCTNKNDFDVTKIEKDIIFEKDTFLSKSRFTDVKIIGFSERREYWVHKVDQEKIFQEMMLDLQKIVQRMSKTDPIIGDIYGYKFENLWYRTKIISLNPIKIFYVDHGVTETVEVNDFREINDLKTMIPFARKIRLSKNTPKKYEHLKIDHIITVKPVAFEESVIIVDVKNGNENSNNSNELLSFESQSNIKSYTTITKNDTSKMTSNLSSNISKEKSSNEDTKSKYFSPDANKNKYKNDYKKNKNKTTPSCLPNVINFLSVNVCGFLKVNVVLHNKTYGITLRPNDLNLDFKQIVTDLPEKCASVKLNHEYKPNIGELICGQEENGDWHRGFAVTLHPIKQLAIIDKTKIIPIKKIVPYPNEFLNICVFGVVCEITTNNFQLLTNNHYEFKVINCKEEVTIEIQIDDKNKITGILRSWEPIPEQSGIQLSRLKNGSEVCITFYHSHYLMYVRSLETEDSEEFNKLMQRVAKCAQSAVYLKEPPVLGEMIMAQFMDNNFYRAIITKIQGEEASISYIDFGNTEKTLWKKLRILPNDLKMHRSCAAKIYLKDVPTDAVMTKEVTNYLLDLTGREVPLKCIFDGTPSTDGVYLTTANGESINDKIKKLLIPSWDRKSDEDKIVYMINDINIFPLGDIGETVNVLVLSTIKEGVDYFMCPLDIELITHINEILPPLMNKYCEKTDYYIPRRNELCLSLYNNNWYRAVCLSPTELKDKSIVFYIDYGNCEEVLHKDIRPMIQDFLIPSALANMCTIVNLAPKQENGSYSAEVLNKISELVNPNTICLAKIVDFDSEGNYKIELPDVRDKLIKESLIPPY